jgi:two-component system cell cycle sensor histidine kinase/response regulator CckA
MSALDRAHPAAGREAALDRLSQRYPDILRSSMDGFFVVDGDCRFLDVNDAFCRMVGYARHELLGMRITDLEIHEADGRSLPEHTRTGLHRFPAAHRHRDGRTIYLELSVHVLRDGAGRILVGVARDITDRRRSEAELVRLISQQKLILHSAADGIIGLDGQGLITQANPAAGEMFGERPGALLGREAHQVLFQSGARPACADSACVLCRVLRGVLPAVQGRERFRRPDGSDFPVEFSLTATRDESNRLGAVLVFRDMSERERAEAQRLALEQEIQKARKLESLGLLAGGIAHDLNNMLATIMGHASAALMDERQESARDARLQRIIGACGRASRLIGQVLASAGRAPCAPSPAQLSDLIRELAEFLRPAVPSAIQLEVDLAADAPWVDVDTAQLEQVLMNLVVNAVEAIGPRGGVIRISASREELSAAGLALAYPGQGLAPGTFGAVRVQDDGCGMSADTLQRIFEPFFSHKGSSRGLGLAVMRGIVRAHRGGVGVHSTPGHGTCFTLLFPASGAAGAAPAAPCRLAPPSADDATEDERRATPRTVLVIDDDHEVREVICDMLVLRGVRVLSEPDGERGISCFRAHAGEIDVVLLDMTMPGMSGAEVFRELIAIRPDARVIVSSGHSEDSLPQRFGAQQPADLIHKPFTIDTLLDKVRRVMHRTSGNGGPQRRPAS